MTSCPHTQIHARHTPPGQLPQVAECCCGRTVTRDSFDEPWQGITVEDWRGVDGKGGKLFEFGRKVCHRGHPLDGVVSTTGKRYCKTCMRNRASVQRAKAKRKKETTT